MWCELATHIDDVVGDDELYSGTRSLTLMLFKSKMSECVCVCWGKSSRFFSLCLRMDRDCFEENDDSFGVRECVCLRVYLLQINYWSCLFKEKINMRYKCIK